MQNKSILDLVPSPDEPVTNERPIVRRKRGKCAYCGGWMYMDPSLESRNACRYCLHLGYRPITTREGN